MKFYIIDNNPLFSSFENKYSARINSMYPALNGVCLTVYGNSTGNGQISDIISDSDIDTPYFNNHIYDHALRCNC